jgi:hypothetical protein
MQVALIILGFGLVIVGLVFALRGLGKEKAEADATKGFAVSGPAWLILVAIGAATIVFGSWHYDQSNDSKVPATTTTITTTTSSSIPDTTVPDTTVPDTTLPAIPFTYGDNPLMDELWNRCVSGEANLLGCDLLYQNSAAGTDYEYFAATCGYRLNTPVGLLTTDPNYTCQDWAQSNPPA